MKNFCLERNPPDRGFLSATRKHVRGKYRRTVGGEAREAKNEAIDSVLVGGFLFCLGLAVSAAREDPSQMARAPGGNWKWLIKTRFRGFRAAWNSVQWRGRGQRAKEEGCTTYAVHRVAAPPPRKGVGPWEEAGLSSRSWTNGELACAPRSAIAKPIPLLLRGGRGSRRPHLCSCNSMHRGWTRWTVIRRHGSLHSFVDQRDRWLFELFRKCRGSILGNNILFQSLASSCTSFLFALSIFMFTFTFSFTYAYRTCVFIRLLSSRHDLLNY